MVNQLLIGRIRRLHLLLSVTPVWCMDTANFINVEVRVYYSFSKHSIFRAKPKNHLLLSESLKSSSWKSAACFFYSTLKNSLTFASYIKTMQNGLGEVVKVLYCYYSWDSREIVLKFPCMEEAKFHDCNRTFCPQPCADVFEVAPCEGLRGSTHILTNCKIIFLLTI